MSPWIQSVVVGAIIAAALVFVGLRSWRALRGGRSSCCSPSDSPSGCGEDGDVQTGGTRKDAAPPCAGCSGCG